MRYRKVSFDINPLVRPTRQKSNSGPVCCSGHPVRKPEVPVTGKQ